MTREVGRNWLSVTADRIPDVVSGQVSVAVPLDAPPSLALSHNKIVWSVQVRVHVPGMPDDNSKFEVTVMPEVLR